MSTPSKPSFSLKQAAALIGIEPEIMRRLIKDRKRRNLPILRITLLAGALDYLLGPDPAWAKLKAENSLLLARRALIEAEREAREPEPRHIGEILPQALFEYRESQALGSNGVEQLNDRLREKGKAVNHGR